MGPRGDVAVDIFPSLSSSVHGTGGLMAVDDFQITVAKCASVRRGTKIEFFIFKRKKRSEGTAPDTGHAKCSR